MDEVFESVAGPTTTDFAIPEELVADPPRRVVARLSRIWPSRVWREKHMMALAVLIIAVTYLVVHALVWAHPQATAGMITGKGVRPQKGGPYWFVTYAYGADGNQFDAEEGCTQAFFDQARPGQRVHVSFKGSDDWRESTLADPGTFHNDPWIAFARIALVGLGFTLPIYALISYRESNRQRRLIQLGLPAVAKVVTVGQRSLRWELPLTFRFVTRDGRHITGGSKRMPESETRALKPGDPLLILYDPEKPRLHEAYAAMAFVPASPAIEIKSTTL